MRNANGRWREALQQKNVFDSEKQVAAANKKKAD